MKSSSLSEIKNELSTLTPAKVLALCMRLAKYKKENKELLSYLLFYSHNEQDYIISIKNETDEKFEEINRSNIYYVKKSLRKILRNINKHIKYSGSAQTETELLIYFCKKIKDFKIPINTSTVLNNLYRNQIIKINKAMAKLHEDLQYDYRKEVEVLQDILKGNQ